MMGSPERCLIRVMNASGNLVYGLTGAIRADFIQLSDAGLSRIQHLNMDRHATAERYSIQVFRCKT